MLEGAFYQSLRRGVPIFFQKPFIQASSVDADAEGVSIYKYDGNGKVALAYMKIVEEVLDYD